MPIDVTAPMPMLLDLLRWVSVRKRTYRETMDAWRTSCPRFPVWEDALASGLVAVARDDGQDDLIVTVTPEGERFQATADASCRARA